MSSSAGQQRFPESQFFNRLLAFSLINTIWISLLSRYAMLKGKYWIIDELLKQAETTVFWVEQKAEDVASTYKLDNYLKKIDTAASDAVTKVEDTVPNVVKKVQDTASGVVTKVQDTASNVITIVDDSRKRLIKNVKTQ